MLNSSSFVSRDIKMNPALWIPAKASTRREDNYSLIKVVDGYRYRYSI